MAPRPRKPGNKDMPDHLYPRKDKRTGKTYYAYRDPRTGREYGLGSDKTKAIREARAANMSLLAAQPTLLERMAVSAYTVADWIPEYQEVVAERGLSPVTIKTMGMRLKTIEKWVGDKALSEVTTLDFTTHLKALASEGKAQMARVMRSLATDLFREAIAAGHCKENPLLVTKAPRIKVKRERLSLEQWQAIHAEAAHPWLARAMELAIITGQRREDIAGLKFTDYRDGFLHVIQGKTGSKVRISGTLRLDAVGMSLDEVIKRCRDNVVSPYLIHHHKAAGRAKAGQPVVLDTLSKEFANARDRAVAAKVIKAGDKPPTFHEQRSLAARLYHAEGKDPQALLGHRHAAMTEIYRDSRGSEWVSVM